MKNYLPAFLLSFFCLCTTAQQNHFIYLQTENKQPFYIKLDDKVLSSSASGYLIISKLQEGTYKVIVGFSKNEWPEQEVTLRVEKKDVGYLIKNYGEKGWGFINLQNQNVTMAGGVVPKEEVIIPKENDIFSTTLANVVNDSTILEKDIVKQEVKKPVEQNGNAEVKDSDKTIPVAVKSVITRKLKKSSKTGTEFVYTDKTGDQTDTIRIFIPFDKMEKKEDSVTVAEISIPDKKTDEPVKNTEDKKIEVIQADNKKNEVTQPAEEKKDEPKQKEEPKQVVQESKPDDKKFIDFEKTETKKDTIVKQRFGMINPDCKSFASEDDFLKLRKKMAAETSDDDMLRVAKKVFKSKCFPTEYIKNLGALFLKDEGKYMFYDAAYPYVSDSDIFPSLESQLTDSYYINRFRAMIHK